jgi:hypothetical protein
MSLKSLPAALGIAVAMLVATALPAVALPAEAMNDVNVRECGSTDCDIVDVLHEGESVEVEYCQDVWCAIRHPGNDGFVHARYLAPQGDFDEEDFANLRRDRRDRDDRDDIVIIDDDEFFDDEDFFDDDEIFFERRRLVRRFDLFFGACTGGRNARVCIWD